MRFKRAHMLALGVRLRALREGRHWSLDRLSKNAGVSAAAIQKIEAGISNPSLVTIVAIIDALGASVDKLISDVRQADDGVTVVRNLLQTKAGTTTPLSSTRTDRRLDCRVIALSARQKLDETVRGKPAFGYVLDGGLRLGISDEEVVELGTGDAFHAGSETSLEWSNPLARRSVVLCINDANGQKAPLSPRSKR